MLNIAMRVNKLSLIILLTIFPFISGCASFHSASYFDDGTYSPTDPESVKIFYTTPSRNFVKIGEVSASGAPASNVDNMIAKLKIEAAKMGGDAIMLKTSYTSTKQIKEPASSKTDIDIDIDISQQQGPYTVLSRPEGTYAYDPGYMQNIEAISETFDTSPSLNGIVIKFIKEQ